MALLEACRRAAAALERFERGDERDAEWLAEPNETCPVCAPLAAPLPAETVHALLEPAHDRAADADRAERPDDAFFTAQRGAVMDALLRSGHNARIGRAIAPPARRAWASRARSKHGRRAGRTYRTRRAVGVAVAAGIALVALGRALVPTSGEDGALRSVMIARQADVAAPSSGVTAPSRPAREHAPLRGSAALAASPDAWLVADFDPLATPQAASVAMGVHDLFERLEDDDIEALSDLLGAYGGWSG
jgi:hypothetical protein